MYRFKLLESTEIKTKLARPFLKWAGGKSQLLPQFSALYPNDLKQGTIDRYIEPFLGGGAVFFEIAQTHKLSSVFLYDRNPELILAYLVVRDHLNLLIEQLHELSEHYKRLTEGVQKLFYNEVRDSYNTQRLVINYETYSPHWIPRAAQLIFLNKTCFNGLFRLNRKGEFNVPHGKYKNPKILDLDNLKAVSQLLKIAEIQIGDFETCQRAISSDSLIYFDPPYRPLSKTANFTSYSKFDFNDKQQIRLAHFFRDLHEHYPVKMMLSNSDPKNTNPTDTFFDDLYHGFQIYRVLANRAINSNGQRRNRINELLITNYSVRSPG